MIELRQSHREGFAPGEMPGSMAAAGHVAQLPPDYLGRSIRHLQLRGTNDRIEGMLHGLAMGDSEHDGAAELAPVMPHRYGHSV